MDSIHAAPRLLVPRRACVYVSIHPARSIVTPPRLGIIPGTRRRYHRLEVASYQPEVSFEPETAKAHRG